MSTQQIRMQSQGRKIKQGISLSIGSGENYGSDFINAVLRCEKQLISHIIRFSCCLLQKFYWECTVLYNSNIIKRNPFYNNNFKKNTHNNIQLQNIKTHTRKNYTQNHTETYINTQNHTLSNTQALKLKQTFKQFQEHTYTYIHLRLHTQTRKQSAE